MSGTAKPKVYWDTCVFLAWIQEEKTPRRKPGDMEGVERVVKLVGKGEMLLFTSVVTHAEILDSTLSPRAKQRYLDLFERAEIIEMGVDHPIAVLASELRNFYRDIRESLPEKEREKAISLATPDALHLATAIHYKADEFHTFDGDSEKGKPGLLSLCEIVGNHRLRVCKPTGDRLALLENVPPIELTKPTRAHVAPGAPLAIAAASASASPPQASTSTGDQGTAMIKDPPKE